MKNAPIDHLNRKSWDLMLQDAEGADELAAEAEYLARASEYPEGLAESLLNRGWTSIYRTAYAEALRFLFEAEEIFTRINNNEGLAKTINAQGVAYHNQSDYNQALETYRRGLALAETRNLPDRIISVLNNIGEVYLEINRIDDANEYFMRALELLTDRSGPELKESLVDGVPLAGDEEQMAVIIGNIGSTSLKNGDFSSAEKCFSRALNLARKNDDRIVESEVLTMCGVLELERGNAGAAEEYHTQSLRVSRNSNNNLSRISTIIHLGDLHVRMGQNDSAMELYQQAVSAAEGIGSPYLESWACSRMADTLEKDGRFDAALKMHRRYARVRLQLLSESSEQKLKSLQERIESERLKIANERLELINDFAREVTSTLDLDEVFNRIYERVNELIEAHVFTIALYDDESHIIDFLLTIEDGERIPPVQISSDRTDSFAAYAVREKTPVIIKDRESESHRYLQSDSPPERGKRSLSLVFMPLEIKDRVVGVLSVQSQKTNAYSDLDLSLIRTLSSFVAIAIDNALIVNRVTMLNQLVRREKDELQTAYQRITFLANHDHLTGLANRRMFVEMLDLSIAQTKTVGGSLAVFFIDLDKFKPVNDAYGHDTGDEVLKIVAERVKALLRQEDLFARLGGDEFVGIVQHVPSLEVMQGIADKIHQRIGETMTIGGKTVHVGASLGVALFPEHGNTSDILIRAADNAMYFAKQDDETAVVFAEKPVPAESED